MAASQALPTIQVATRDKVLGAIHLKDVVKGGIKERFAQFRKMGIKTIMITGDNKLTAAAIAATGASNSGWAPDGNLPAEATLDWRTLIEAGADC